MANKMIDSFSPSLLFRFIGMGSSRKNDFYVLKMKENQSIRVIDFENSECRKKWILSEHIEKLKKYLPDFIKNKRGDHEGISIPYITAKYLEEHILEKHIKDNE